MVSTVDSSSGAAASALTREELAWRDRGLVCQRAPILSALHVARNCTPPSVQVVCVGGVGWFSCEEFPHQVYGARVDFISRIRTFRLFVRCLCDLCRFQLP